MFEVLGKTFVVERGPEIHQPLLSHFSLLVEFLIGKVPVYNKDCRVLRLVNLTPDYGWFGCLATNTSARRPGGPGSNPVNSSKFSNCNSQMRSRKCSENEKRTWLDSNMEETQVVEAFL